VQEKVNAFADLLCKPIALPTAGGLDTSILQRAPASAGAKHHAPPIVHEVVHSPGQPLDVSTRALMETRFGYDFSHVRVHADSRASQSAEAVGAAAYTVGKDIVFANGHYAPQSSEGQSLLAHELAHTMQQRDAPRTSSIRIADAKGAHESAAEQASQAPLGNATNTAKLGRTAMALQRQPVKTGGTDSTAGQPRKQTSAVKKPDVQTITDISIGGFPILDAELDRRGVVNDEPCRLTLSTKVLFKPQGQWPPGRFAKWQQEYIRVVTNRWSFRFLLIPSGTCEGETCKIATAQVRVIPVTSNPHHTINVDYFKPEGVPSSTDLPGPSQAYESDIRREERDLRKTHATASHEFGHMLGLDHVHCDSNDEECYGTNREEKADVMGQGEIVTERDYQPFINAMQQMTGCNWKTHRHSGPVYGNASWLLAGFLGVLGLLGGVLLGGGLGAMILMGGLLGSISTFAGYQIGKLLD
jgi:hypothetical protein